MDNYLYYDKSFVPAIFGLNNTGAICWCNALLQTLLSLSSFNTVMLECKDILSNNKLAIMYIKMLEEILPESTTGIQYNNINNLNEYSTKFLLAISYEMRRLKRSCNIMGQFDANEGFHLILELLNCEHIYRLFNNKYEITIKCTACHTTPSIETDVSVQIHYHDKRDVKTKREYCEYIEYHPSELENYKCSNCHIVKKKRYRHCELKMLREIISIYYDKTNKDTSQWYPEYLKFRTKNSKFMRYKLVSIINWRGRIDKKNNYISSGHYWSNVLRVDTSNQLQLYCADDSSVDTIKNSTDESSNSNVYMLMYHIIE